MKAHIQLLLLDVDGVLLHYQRARRVLHLAQALDLPAQTVQHALFDSGTEQAYDSGMLDTVAYLQQLEQNLQRRLPAALWTQARVAACQADPGVLQRLLALPASLPLAILTNNGPLMAGVIAQLLPQLLPRLQDRVLCSGELGGRKPDPALFSRALQRLQAEPGQTLFVDDLFVNVRGARQAGLHAETVRDGRSLGKVLKRYGLPQRRP